MTVEVIHPDQFLGLPPAGESAADAVILPLPLERTVSYGGGTWRAPRAIVDASCEVEVFDEETLVEFGEHVRLHTAAAVIEAAPLVEHLDAIRKRAEQLRGRFVLSLGGEHTVTWGMVMGLAPEPGRTTIVQIDAHADLIDELDDQKWSHGTVMRRLREEGCRLVQIGVRSLSRAEYEFAAADPDIRTFYAHQLAESWPETLQALRQIEGDAYLSIDVDGLDPSVIPSTGTPQPNGLSWAQTMEIIRTLVRNPKARVIAADVVEFVASPHPPGCDIIAARLAAKVLAYWAAARRSA